MSTSIHKPEYLKELEKADEWESLVRPSYAANELDLKHRPFFEALNAGIIPSYTVAGQRYVCMDEIWSILQLMKHIEKT